MENGMLVTDVAGKQLKRYEQRGRPIRVDSPGASVSAPCLEGEKRNKVTQAAGF